MNELGDFRVRDNLVNGRFQGGRARHLVVEPGSDLAADQAVEDVGLRHQHLARIRARGRSRRAPSRRRRSRRRGPARVRGCAPLFAFSVASVRNTSSAAVARQTEVVDPLRVVLGMPELDRGDGRDGAGESDERCRGRCPGDDVLHLGDPSFSGTLKSTRTSTRAPSSSGRSRTDRLRKLLNQLFLQDAADQVDQAVRIAPLVVVPGEHLHEGPLEDGGGSASKIDE